MRALSSLCVAAALLLTACAGANDPTPIPTFAVSGPTLEPSPTIRFLSSGELYADVTPEGANNPASAALPSGQYQPPLLAAPADLSGMRDATFQLTNGVALNGVVQEAISDQRVPGVLLLGPRAANWGELPARLAGLGFTAAAVSMTRFDFNAAEVATLLETVALLPSVDPARLAIIAELEAADWALEGCGLSGLCKALAILSPTNRARAEASMPRFAPRPLLIAAAEDDVQSYPLALALSAQAATSIQYVPAVTGRGAGLLSLAPTLEFQLIAFLQASLEP